MYSAAPGASSGIVFGPIAGTVTQEFVTTEQFVNTVQLGPLRASLAATCQVVDDACINVFFKRSAVQLLGQTVIDKEMSGGGQWKYIWARVITDQGQPKLIRVMETPSLFMLEQDWEGKTATEKRHRMDCSKVWLRRRRFRETTTGGRHYTTVIFYMLLWPSVFMTTSTIIPTAFFTFSHCFGTGCVASTLEHFLLLDRLCSPPAYADMTRFGLSMVLPLFLAKTAAFDRRGTPTAVPNSFSAPEQALFGSSFAEDCILGSSASLFSHKLLKITTCLQ